MNNSSLLLSPMTSKKKKEEDFKKKEKEENSYSPWLGNYASTHAISFFFLFGGFKK